MNTGLPFRTLPSHSSAHKENGPRIRGGKFTSCDIADNWLLVSVRKLCDNIFNCVAVDFYRTGVHCKCAVVRNSANAGIVIRGNLSCVICPAVGQRQISALADLNQIARTVSIRRTQCMSGQIKGNIASDLDGDRQLCIPRQFINTVCQGNRIVSCCWQLRRQRHGRQHGEEHRHSNQRTPHARSYFSHHDSSYFFFLLCISNAAGRG